MSTSPWIPGTLPLGAVLPHLEVIVETGLRLVLGEPEAVIQQLAQVVLHIPLIGVEVDHRLIARLLDGAAESQCHLIHGVAVDGVGAGAAVADHLPVKDHRHGQVIVSDPLQDEPRLLQRLLHGNGLGEEVGPHRQPGIQRALDVPVKVCILIELALGVAPAAHPDDSELHTGIGRLLPVDLPLELGHPPQGAPEPSHHHR